MLEYLNKYIKIIETYNVTQNNLITTFHDFNKTIDLKTERYIEEIYE